MLIIQNAYCFGLVILTIATADKLLVALFHPVNAHLNLMILYFGVGTSINHFFDYILWHYYWYEEFQYIGRTGKHVEQIRRETVAIDSMEECKQQIGDAAEKAEWQAVSTKQREQELLDLAEELKAKFEVSEDAKKQLEQQLSALNSRVEELSEKTLQTDETRIRELEAANVEITDQLSKTKQLGQMLEKSRQELDVLRQQVVEEKIAFQQEMTEQMESVAQKAAADLFAAKEKEGYLQKEELEAKVEASDNAKRRLEQQLLALNVRVEELAENALHSMKQRVYEDQIRDLKSSDELIKARKACCFEIEKITQSSGKGKEDFDGKCQLFQQQFGLLMAIAHEESALASCQAQANHQKSFNQTARFPASPSAAAGTTMLHPDDQTVE